MFLHDLLDVPSSLPNETSVETIFNHHVKLDLGRKVSGDLADGFPCLQTLVFVADDRDEGRVLIVLSWDADVHAVLVPDLGDGGALLSDQLGVELRVHIHGSLEGTGHPVLLLGFQTLHNSIDSFPRPLNLIGTPDDGHLNGRRIYSNQLHI